MPYYSFTITFENAAHAEVRETLTKLSKDNTYKVKSIDSYTSPFVFATVRVETNNTIETVIKIFKDVLPERSTLRVD